MATISQTETASQPGVLRLQQGVTRKIAHSDAGLGSFQEIPVLDVSGMHSSSLADRQKVAVEVREACTKVGFMQISGHGIDWKIVEDALGAAKEFFALDTERKMTVFQDKNRWFLGYEPLYYTNVGQRKLGDCKEAFSFGYDPADDPDGPREMLPYIRKESLWPAEDVIADFRPRMVAYQQALLRFARNLIRIFALALDLPEDYFDKKITTPMAGVRSLHYPSMKGSDEEETGLGAHTDIELFTMIAQTETDEPALEVLNAAGEFIKVAARPGCFVVNLADMFMRMTNDRFLSTVHRVINKGTQDRYSLPFFFGANANELIEVVPTCVMEGEEPKYSGLTTYEHSMRRLKIARYKHPKAKDTVVELPKEYVMRDGLPVY